MKITCSHDYLKERMAPEGFNVITGNKRTSEFGQLYSFVLPLKKSKKIKIKNNVAKGRSFRNKQSVVFPSNSDDDVVVLDSRISNSGNSDDDVIILNSPPEEIVISESENELHTSEQIDSDIEVLENNNDVPKVEDNIVINIGQTLDIDKIISNEKSNVNNVHNLLKNRAAIETETQSEHANVENIQKTQYPKSWTKKMIKYYTEPDEETRNFDYKEILKNLKTQPSDWWINTADRIGSSNSRRSFVQCRRCHRTGHMEKECSQKTVCYVCGGYNHVFGNCPNTVCFTCGKPARKNLHTCFDCRRNFSTRKSCDLCGQMNHEKSLCPSKWRKHLILDNSNQPAKVNPRKFCYNCAAVGHFGFECPMTPYSIYPSENPFRTTFFDECSQQSTNGDNVLFVSKKTADLLGSENGDKFLKVLSDSMNARIELFRGVRDYIRIIGEENEMNLFKDEFRKWKSQIASLI